MKIRHKENFTLRVARPLLLCCLLAICLAIPPSPASASGSPAAWSAVPLPQVGQAGQWVLAPGTTLRHLALAADGTVYACADGATQALFHSVDSGLTWTLVKPLTDAVIALATSPVDPAVLYYATADSVCRPADGGAPLAPPPARPGNSGQGNRRITSLAVTHADGWLVAVGVADDDPAEYGGVWTMAESTGTYTWTDTDAGALDVLAVAFSPVYPFDRQLAAIATDETDTFTMFRSGDLPWNTITSPATFHPGNGTGPVVAVSAVLAFPESASGTPVLFVGLADGANGGDVYQVTGNPGSAAASDLNFALGSGLVDLDVGALCVTGTYPGFSLCAGPAGTTDVYTSRDAGTTWNPALKPPPGTSVTSLLASNDPISPLLAATSGPGGGLSRAAVDGIAWDEVSCIDTSLDLLVNLAPSPAYELDGTLFLLTFGGGTGSLWHTRDEGMTWQRIFWTGTGVTSLDRVAVSPGYGTGSRVIYCAGDSGGSPALWVSRDGGGAFDLRPTVDPSTGVSFSIDAWTVTGDDTVFIAGSNGASNLVYRTDTAGFFYRPGASLGTQPIASLVATPNNPDFAILAGSNAGRVYLSRDGGLTFQPVPPTAPAVLPAAPVDVAFDSNFAASGIVYAAAAATDSGVYRFHTSGGTDWETIDATLPAGGAIASLAIGPEGVLYGVDNTAALGMERSLEPARSNPSFATVTRGLPDGSVLNGLWRSGGSLWSLDTAHNRLLRFDDTLTRPVAADQPVNTATDCGTVSGHAVTGVRLSWSSLPGATGYEWQCDTDDSFANLAAGMTGTTTALSLDLPTLQPATTYYWRLRASAPAPGPWSLPRTFTTRLAVEPVGIQPDLPAPGATDIAVRPLFQWTAVSGADAYELLVAQDTGFNRPVIARQGADALPANAWAADVSLAPGTTYYWKVRALSAGATSEWSAAGIFTTAALVTETPSPPTTTTPPSPAAGSSTGSSPTLQPFASATSPTMTVISSPAPITVSPPPVTVLYEPDTVPSWLLYTIGGVLVALVLMLAVLLVVVLRLRVR